MVLLHIMRAPSHVLAVLLGSVFGVLALGCFQVFLFEFLHCFLLSHRDCVGRTSFPLDMKCFLYLLPVSWARAVARFFRDLRESVVVLPRSTNNS